MCIKECCCNGWVGILNSIAAIDLITGAVQVTFETASLGVLGGLLMPYNSTRATRFSCTSAASHNASIARNCPWFYDYAGFDDNPYIHLDFDSAITDVSQFFGIDITLIFIAAFVVTIVILAVFGGFIIEGFLFSLLRRGVNEAIHKECKRWFFYRLIILVFVTTGSALKYYFGVYYSPIDGLLDGFKVYRVVTLIIVHMFMNELAITVGKIYVKLPKRPKRGSL